MGVAIHVFKCDGMFCFGRHFIVEVLLNVFDIAFISLINAMFLQVVVLFQALLEGEMLVP